MLREAGKMELTPETGDGSKGSKETREKLVVSKIYQLIHPDFDVGYYGQGASNPRHKNLRSLWEEKINQIVREPDSILFYVSAFPIEAFQVRAKVKRGEVIAGAAEKWAVFIKDVERDLTRILEAKKKLGRRLILLFTQDQRNDPWFDKQRERLKKILEAKSIEIPPRTPISCFGEYFEECVDKEVKKLGLILGSPDFVVGAPEYVEKIPELSLSVEDPDSFVSQFL
ncbi:MAG: hypothetical protein HYW89_01005 [Candidatus Sungiibacteriota bacterium]|uniref:Uncharacterized protein n=1 Tax=Candidatus Sungiibacteriota bacterium TaxID=2750080 RepID=A0A7T5RJU6_9BACT|nr:MAG: hypothetical protein HYW89_01005 [Candidatus Sungbacteria bacterium]